MKEEIARFESVRRAKPESCSSMPSTFRRCSNHTGLASLLVLCAGPAATKALRRLGFAAELSSHPHARRTEPCHRIRFVYVPKHTSWLNQIEIWFSILVRRVIKRGNFTSVANLREKILAFIDYFNRTLAKPFKWTYTGRPLNV
jgi:transposase